MKRKEEDNKEKNTLEKKLKKNLEINDEKGLALSYNKNDLETQLPELMHELSVKKKTLKIGGMDDNIEQKQSKIEGHRKEAYCENHNNPGVIDFLRRCTESEDALAILDFLLEQKKLNPIEFHRLKDQIKEEGGLKELILEYGGLKKPGYYERKFPRKKNLTDDEL